MKLYLLFLTTIVNIKVNAEILGLRITGDSAVSYREFGYPAGPHPIKVGYPTIEDPTPRPEVFSCFDFKVIGDPNFVFVFYGGGLNHTDYTIQVLYRPVDYILIAYGKPPQETTTKGSLSREDKLLHMDKISKLALPNKIIVVNLKYPKVVGSTATITWISVLDERNNDTASIKVVRGGVDFKEVHIKLSSRVGEGLNFKVQIYGRDIASDSWPWYLSVNAHTEALLFEPYWPWDFSNIKVKKNCGCRTGRLLSALP